MLHHVQDMSIPCSPAKNELHDDERKPLSLVPTTEEANQPDAGGDLVRIEDVTEQSTHDAKPA